MRLSRSVLVAVVFALAAAVTSPPSPASASGSDHWAADRQSAGRDGYNSAETRITASNAYLLRPKWTQRATYYSRSAPAIADGVVYAPQRGELRAVDRVSGAKRWSRAFPNADLAAPVVSGNLVYIGVSWEGNELVSSLYALDRATGRTVWRRLAGSTGFEWTGVLGGGRLYTSFGSDAPLVALDPVTGRTLWSRSSSRLNPTYGVAYDNGRLYLQTDVQHCTGSVSAVDGRGLFVHACSTGRTPVVKRGVLYMAGGGSGSDPIVIKAVPTGCTSTPCPGAWTTTLPGRLGHALSVGRGRVYVPSVVNGSPALQVLDAVSGRPLFTGAGPSAGQISSLTSVAVAGNVAYLSFDHRQEVYAFPAAGCGRSACLPLNVLGLGSSSSGGPMSAVTVAEGTAAVAVSYTGVVALRTD